MNNPIPALIFGLILIGISSAMFVSQRRAIRSLGAGMSKGELLFFKRRHRRRNQIAGMILIIGLMIPIGDSLIPWQDAPATFAIYWMIVLFLAMWTGLLGMGDLVSTKTYGSFQLDRLQRQEAELRDAAERLKREVDR